jgi:hypothetical protein
MVALVAIVALAVLSMAIVAAIYPNGRGAAQTTGEPTPTAPVYRPPTPITVGPPRTGSQPPTSPGRGDSVSAIYEVINRWDNDRPGFQARITLTNHGSKGQDWQVRLSYHGQVRRIATMWVNGGDPPVTTRSGSTFRFNSAVGLPSGGTIELYVQFDASTDAVAEITPTSCTVNGEDCAGI